MSFSKKIKFYGDGGQLFGIYIINFLLTGITLGFYYPWARAAMLRYVYQQTEFAGSRMTFHGTGGEMFMGMIKGILFVLALYVPIVAGVFLQSFPLMIIGALIFVVGMLLIIPIAIHGALRYRLSRSSWRGIHFSYQGKLSELISEFIIGMLLTMVTFGFYRFWFTVKLRKFISSRVYFGNARFTFEGNGMDFFLLSLKGLFLSAITLGIYFFWFAAEMFNYFLDNTRMHQNRQEIRMRGTLKGGDYFGLMLVNLLMTIFTLGLATPWVTVRTLRFIYDNIEIEDTFDAESLAQSPEDYRNVKGDDMADILDIGIA